MLDNIALADLKKKNNEKVNQRQLPAAVFVDGPFSGRHN